MLRSKYTEVSVTHLIKTSHVNLSEEKWAAFWLHQLPTSIISWYQRCISAWQNECKASRVLHTKDTAVAQVSLLVSRSCRGCPLCAADVEARCFAVKGRSSFKNRSLCHSGLRGKKTGVKGTRRVFWSTAESKNILSASPLSSLCGA